ncbi:lipopolysaccharide biosynthesis protein [Clostridium gasigenes]|uniref:Oligosaccharide flippase family protein n=1 Tax=Clostridium gasigenes TaxID=94869 RepID=A0A7X0S9J8_9CLOT|nr:oligosaccharide flippase family protein [Clostridium gasigenes]MBB6713500.1 oligosaccharide flippase family protein [Clostridium gasigenes]
MNKEKKLIKNTLIYAVGNLGSKLLTFIMLPIYTEYLLTSEYGNLDLIISTISLIMPIVTFQITDGIYRFILTEENKEEIKKYISNGIFVVITNLIVFTGIYTILSCFIKFENKILIYVYFITMVFYTLWAQIARGLKKNLEYAISGIIVTVVTAFLNILLIVKFGLGVKGFIISYIVGFIAAFLYLEKTTHIIDSIKITLKDKKIKKKLCKFSIPLIPNVISWWVMNVSDRYMITYFLTDSVNGIYSIANKFASIIVIINTFFSLAWQESAILEYESEDRDKYYTKMFNSYMKLQFTGMLILLSVTRLAFVFYIKGDFLDGYKIVPILYMASVFSAFSVFYGTGYISANDTKGSFYTTVIGAMLNIFINIFTIPMLGIYGAAVSTLISYAVVWILRVIQTKKYFKIIIDKKDFGILLTLNIVFSMLYYSNNIYINMIMILISIIVFIAYNKKLVRKILSFVVKSK